MKSKLLILMFLTSFAIFAQYTNIPDSNFESKLIALGIDRDGKNGKVLTSSITNVTTLDVSLSQINDLSGIQDFLSLTTLACYLNNLTSLDLSKNIKLSTIDCRANKIKNLDVSTLSQLVGILCSENFLTSLDVSKNPLVSGVFCSKNNLISLNLKNGNNTNFQNIFCDFTNNPLLSCIQVDNSDYSNSKWSSYKDATTVYSNSCGPSYTNIPDSNFENKLISLGIDNDGVNGKVLTANIIFLTELNISNSLIANLSGIENFTNLETLNVSNNQLSVLHIPTLQKIKNLDCSKNFLKQLDFTENGALQTLNFSNNKVSSINIGYQAVLETLLAGSNELTTIDISPYSNLKNLEINNNKLTNLSLYNKNLLSFLNCSNNLLTSLEVSKNTALISLYCGSNKLIKLDITANLFLKEITCENNLLIELNLKNGKNTLFTNYDFRNNPSLTCIVVDNQSYSDLNWFSKKDATTSYYIDCGPFTLIPDPKFEDKLIALGIDIDGKKGSVSTKSIINLTTLDLSNSLITDLSGIQDFVNLKTLNVSSNALTKLDLSKNILLANLNCSYNKIEGLDFEKNTNLIDLFCNNNNLNALNLKNKYNTLIKNVDFRNNANLTCIQVDNEAYSNQYWLDKKDKVVGYTPFCGEYTLIPDPAFEKRLISLGIDIDGFNGKVFTAHIRDLTTLNLSGYQFSDSTERISDMTGIQDFKKLQELKCNSNNIKNLTLTENKELITLDCSYNSIEKIDLSKNILLKTFKCVNCKLTNLDVSSLVSLENLDCSVNSLKVLDVSKNSALKSLTCISNQINELNLSNCKQLTYLECSWNQINDLNLSNCKLLTTLRSTYNLLTNIDVSNNPKLTTIDCANNKLTTANLKNGNNTLSLFLKWNPDLLCIQVDNKDYYNKNYLASKDEIAVFSEDCNRYTAIPDGNFENKLIELGIDKDGKNGKVQTAQIEDVKDLYISDLNISDLKGIEDFKKLTTLYCSYNQITSLDLSKNTALTELNCPYNQITSLDLSKNTKLSSLNCSHNSLSYLNLKNVNLLQINVSKNDFGNNTGLSCIIVDDVNFANQNWFGFKDPTAHYSYTCDANDYVAILDQNFENKLISLGIDKDGLNGKLLKSEAKNVVDLDISGSSIYDVSALEYFTALKNLNCGANNIVELNLYKNTLLTSLNCSNTKITQLDLTKNYNLTSLNCNTTKLNELTLKNGNNKNISSIDLKNNPELLCIEVDDPNYSNLNWSLKKDGSASFSDSCVAYTVIPDENFENRLISLGIDKDGKNGKVKTNSINKISYLDVSDSKISDLTGIEFFTNLEQLICSYNLIENLDISANIRLYRLWVGNNKLKKLDLTKNTNLTSLVCYYNQITELDLSNNTKLSDIFCSNNQLTKLNILQCTTLKFLYCYGNKLTALDIPKSTLLESIDCYNNQIGNLDVSNLTSLQSLECQNNKITNLNVLNNRSLTKLVCEHNNLKSIDISTNSGLKYLDISDNELTNIDLNYNFQLESFYCSNNKLISYIDFRNNELLKTVICLNNQLLGVNLGTSSYTARTQFLGNFLNNPNLCIGVNSLIEAPKMYIVKDSSASFSTNCSFPPYYIAISNEFENKLIALGIDTDGKNNKILYSSVVGVKSLDVSNSGITNLNGIQFFRSLQTLNCKDNLIETINVSNSGYLTHLDCSNNSLLYLSVGNLYLQYLNCSNNPKIGNRLYLNNNSYYANLSELYCDNIFSNINESKETISEFSPSVYPALTKLSYSNNELVSLDVSKNTKLTYLNCSKNNLTNLNLNNNNNTILSTIDLKSNPLLKCIQVDNKEYSDTNWTNFKDNTANFSIDCSILFPSNNFIIESKGETCLNQNNGEINISANASYSYIASINNVNYTFINNKLKVDNLAPGIYNVSITIPGDIFEQKFNITIPKGQIITGKFSSENNKIVIEIESGTAPYKAFVNGIEQFETTATVFDVVANKYDLVEIVTAKTCEGVYIKDATGYDNTLLAYPNPTSGILEIEVPTTKKQMEISLSSTSGQVILNDTYSIVNGKVKLNLEKLSAGIYIVKIGLDTPEYLKIIKN